MGKLKNDRFTDISVTEVIQEGSDNPQFLAGSQAAKDKKQRDVRNSSDWLIGYDSVKK